MTIESEVVRDLEALMAEVPSHRRLGLMPAVRRLTVRLGGAEDDLNYLTKRRTDWAKKDGACEYLVNFQDGPLVGGDPRTFLATEAETLSLLNFKAESLRVLLIGGKGKLTRETKLGTATVQKLKRTLSPAERASATTLLVRERDLFGKKGHARAY